MSRRASTHRQDYFPSGTQITVRRFAGCGCLHAVRRYPSSPQPDHCQRHGSDVEREWNDWQPQQHYTHLGTFCQYRIGFQTAQQYHGATTRSAS